MVKSYRWQGKSVSKAEYDRLKAKSRETSFIPSKKAAPTKTEARREEPRRDKPSGKGTIIDLRDAPYGVTQDPITIEEYNRRTAEREAKDPGITRTGLTTKERERREREKKTGIAEFREKPTIAGKVVKAATSLKTTAVLASALGILLGVGAITTAGRAALATGSRAVITRTASRVVGGRAIASMTTQRAFVGKGTTKAVAKIFHKVRPIAKKYATNKRSAGLTTSLLKKSLNVIKNPAFIIGAIGSYPFAGFIKEEALQTLSIPIMKAIGAGDLETASVLTEEVDAMLAEQDKILDMVPYVNVVNQLIKFFEAASVANEAWKQIIASEGAVATGEVESEFARERRETDIEARQRELEEMALDAEYFRLIREKRFAEADQLLQSQL